MNSGQYQKSVVPITFDELEGPDLHVGEAVIFAFDGAEYPGVCKGWTVNPNGSVYVSIRTGENLLSIKLAQVWRAYDAKDAYFERQLAIARVAITSNEDGTLTSSIVGASKRGRKKQG